MTQNLKFHGIIPANLLPFHADFSIDEPDYRRHLSWLAGVVGVTAITCNGHAAEVSSLTREERQRALAIAGEEVGDRVQLIAGVFAEGTLEAVTLAKDAKAGGAAGILIFPPIADVFYSPPFLDQHNRMKEALVMLGRLKQAVVRPPLHRVSDHERQRIRAALVSSGLLLA